MVSHLHSPRLKARTWLVLLMLLCLARQSVFAQSTAYLDNVVLVKFKASSSLYADWEQKGRRGVITDWQDILSNHSTEALFDDGLIQGVTERFSRLTEDDPAKRTSTLTRWCKISYTAQTDAASLASKLEGLPDVEYAEPLFLRTLTDTPNDPLIGLQDYLRIIRAFDAWDVIKAQGDTSRRVIIAIVDSGVDYTHEDLAANIFLNPGETGLDAQGRDKRTNNVDDDRNGRVDDWHGWDFTGGDDGKVEDNDPAPSNNTHGTHVAGIAGAVTNNRVGVAGVARNLWLLPVKCSPPNTNQVFNGFRGIVYAAVMGATVINCSWGAFSRSQAEQEAITIATELGSFIVSTAGNNGVYTPFFPGSYDNVCSVAWLEDDDTHISGNFHETVDIAAPGTSIYATFTDNRYSTQSGTSMAAPMVSAAAALVKMRFPQLSGRQIFTQLKATADNTDKANPQEVGFLGTGRLNVLLAVQTANPPFVEVRNFTVQDENSNGLLESGERITVSLNLENGNTPMNAATVLMRTTIASDSRFLPFFDDTTKQVTALTANEVRNNAVTFTFRLTTNLTQDFPVPLLFSITDANGKLIGRDAITLLANKSYQTLRGNALAFTLNSKGSFGFNDFPRNSQGDGFLYQPKDTNNLLYEGGLIVANSPDSVSSAVRETSFQRDQAFLATSLLTVTSTSDSTLTSARATYADRGASNQASVSIDQTVQQYRQNTRQNLVLSSYIITNTSNQAFSKLYAGLFFDWDIASYKTNETFWDNECGCGIVQNPIGSFPVIGVKLLSPQTPNFYPIQIGDTALDAITLNFTFSRSEKYRALSSGIISTRKQGDVAHVVGAGAIALQPNASVLVRFGIAAGLSLEEVRGSFRALTQADSTQTRLYPNPASGSAFLEYQLDSPQFVTVELLNALGQVVATPVSRQEGKGWQQAAFALDSLSSGLYWVRLRSATLSFSKALIISR